MIDGPGALRRPSVTAGRKSTRSRGGTAKHFVEQRKFAARAAPTGALFGAGACPAGDSRFAAMAAPAKPCTLFLQEPSASDESLFTDKKIPGSLPKPGIITETVFTAW
jgi:hypothetical protein